MPDKVKKSKKYGLSKLAPNWRERIFESVHSERLKAAIAVLSAAGCRPTELETGVTVGLSNGTLLIGIEGAKLDPATGRGQPRRLLVVGQDTPWGSYLTHKLLSLPDQKMIVTYDSGGVSQRLREKSRELWPRRSSLVSAYSYRHFLGKSMRESGESAEKIAYTLGHASDLSQLKYGRAGGGKKTAGQHGIILAVATNQVRHSPKMDRLAKMTNSRSVTPAEKQRGQSFPKY